MNKIHRFKDTAGREHAEGLGSQQKIGKKYGVSRGTVRRAAMAYKMERYGLILRDPRSKEKLPPDQELRIAHLYKNGASMDELSVLYGTGSVRHILSKHSVVPRPVKGSASGRDSRKKFDLSKYDHLPPLVWRSRLMTTIPLCRVVAVSTSKKYVPPVPRPGVTSGWDFKPFRLSLLPPAFGRPLAIYKSGCTVMPLLPLRKHSCVGCWLGSYREILEWPPEEFQEPPLSGILDKYAFVPLLVQYKEYVDPVIWIICEHSWPEMSGLLEFDLRFMDDEEQALILDCKGSQGQIDSHPIQMTPELRYALRSVRWPTLENYPAFFSGDPLEKIISESKSVRKAYEKARLPTVERDS